MVNYVPPDEHTPPGELISPNNLKPIDNIYPPSSIFKSGIGHGEDLKASIRRNIELNTTPKFSVQVKASEDDVNIVFPQVELEIDFKVKADKLTRKLEDIQIIYHVETFPRLIVDYQLAIHNDKTNDSVCVLPSEDDYFSSGIDEIKELTQVSLDIDTNKISEFIDEETNDLLDGYSIVVLDRRESSDDYSYNKYKEHYNLTLSLDSLNDDIDIKWISNHSFSEEIFEKHEIYYSAEHKYQDSPYLFDLPETNDELRNLKKNSEFIIFSVKNYQVKFTSLNVTHLEHEWLNDYSDYSDYFDKLLTVNHPINNQATTSMIEILLEKETSGNYTRITNAYKKEFKVKTNLPKQEEIHSFEIPIMFYSFSYDDLRQLVDINYGGKYDVTVYNNNEEILPEGNIHFNFNTTKKETKIDLDTIKYEISLNNCYRIIDGKKSILLNPYNYFKVNFNKNNSQVISLPKDKSSIPISLSGISDRYKIKTSNDKLWTSDLIVIEDDYIISSDSTYKNMFNITKQKEEQGLYIPDLEDKNIDEIIFRNHNIDTELFSRKIEDLRYEVEIKLKDLQIYNPIVNKGYFYIHQDVNNKESLVDELFLFPDGSSSYEIKDIEEQVSYNISKIPDIDSSVVVTSGEGKSIRRVYFNEEGSLSLYNNQDFILQEKHYQENGQPPFNIKLKYNEFIVDDVKINNKSSKWSVEGDLIIIGEGSLRDEVSIRYKLKDSYTLNHNSSNKGFSEIKFSNPHGSVSVKFTDELNSNNSYEVPINMSDYSCDMDNGFLFVTNHQSPPLDIDVKCSHNEIEIDHNLSLRFQKDNSINLPKINFKITFLDNLNNPVSEFKVSDYINLTCSYGKIKYIKSIDSISGIDLTEEIPETDVYGNLYCFYELDMNLVDSDTAEDEVIIHSSETESSILKTYINVESVDYTPYTPDHYFVFDEATGTITGYLDEGPRDVVIPPKIDEIEVKKILGNASNAVFINKSLTSVILPDTIVEITGDSGGSPTRGAFFGNQISHLDLGNSIEIISEFSFANNQLTKVIIPDSVKYLSGFNRNQLTELTIPDSVTSIGWDAFKDNQLTSLVIPNSVTYIGGSAFHNNQLTEVVIPNSVTYIGSSAFSGNQLTSVEIPNSVTSICWGVFYNNQLTSVIIPDNVAEIGNWAFRDNELIEITMPDSVTKIGGSAFHNNQLTEVVIPDSVTEIKEHAFGDNPITKLTIPANVFLGDDWKDDDLFSQETFFKDYYEANGSQAGTYTRPNPESTDWELITSNQQR